MNRARLPLLIAAAFASSLAIAGPARHAELPHFDAPKTPAASPAASIEFASGQILVVAKPGVTEAELDARLAKRGSRRLRSVGRQGAHLVHAAPGSETAILQALKADPAILSAELDRKVPLHATLNDPSIGSQYALTNLNVPAAWDITQGQGQTIAILDTGVDSTHPDLAAHMVPGFNFFDNNTDTSDVYGHGTATAGTAAAIGNNGVGVAGICPQCSIMPLRISDTNGYAYLSTMASAVNYAADHGVKTVNISFGGAGSSTLDNAANYLRSKGGNMIMSAGNSGVQEAFSSFNSFTVVSATDSQNNMASFSSTGGYVDVAAPGVSVLTLVRGGGYGNWSGTSFSSPIVAGVYALMRAANPALTPTQLDNILFTTSKDLGAVGKDVQYGNGLVNAQAAVAAARAMTTADTTAPLVSFASPSAGSRLSGLASINANATDNIKVARVELSRNGVLIGTSVAAPWSFAWDTSTVADGPVSLTLKAFDGSGNSSSSTASFTVGNDMTAPVVTSLTPANGSIVSGSVNVSASATDDKKLASLSLLIDGRQVALAYGSSVSYTWNVPRVRGKGNPSSVITATATDAAGNKSSKTVTVQRK